MQAAALLSTILTGADAFPTVLLLIAVGCLVVAGVIFFISRNGAPTAETSEPAASGSTGQSDVPDSGDIPESAEETETKPNSSFDADTADLGKDREIPSAEDARLAMEAGDYAKAAEIGNRRGNIAAERDAVAKVGDTARLAELDRALGDLLSAIEHYRISLDAAPEDENVRLRLIQALLDFSKIDEARPLVDAVSGEEGPIQGSARFLFEAARSFEAANAIRVARGYYRAAAARGVEVEDLSTRLIYLNQLTRLAEAAPPQSQRPDLSAAMEDESPEEFREASPALETRRLRSGGPGAPGASVLEDHSIVVGHLALGGDQRESGYSVRSVASTASRFRYNRLIGERDLTAVFEGVDCLLDCPVAIRISRIGVTGEEFEILRHRLRVISQLNHPNLTKMTFVDHFGPIIRIATEYNGGGTLPAMVKRLDRIGLPLMLRILNQVATGLGTAHMHGILHGDLRPQNIMIGHDQLVKIVDFALQPWPVRSVPSGETSRQEIPSGGNHEVQGDIRQFADLVETLLESVIVAPQLAEAKPNYDPVEELRDLVAKAREGRFSSILQIQRILLQVLDASIPNPSA